MPGLGRATTLVMPEPPLGQPGIVQVGQRFGDQLRVVEQLPEAVGRTGEVMARLRRIGRRG